MANLSYSGYDELILSMQEVANLPDEVLDEMLNAQADIVVDAQRRQAEAMGVHAPGSGLVIKAIKKGKVKVKKGVRSIFITPSGTRKRGKKRVRNAEIAFVNEFGKKKQKARPFIRTANEMSAQATTQAAADVLDRYYTSKNL